ncbi:uncharacterized protein LOC143079280 isoform X1 [Mytilus galloprovincialis]|uniref:uncharacterized protein LOC143079280 isoform X1 n=1 Tax=Mytilus galloprovincialis TaxID=29158 RepID=UPI003F7BE4C0
MATTKKPIDSRQNDVVLKLRVKELEDEVAGLKKRLDELRKAKNTTITKREQKVLEVGLPFGRRDSKTTDAKKPDNTAKNKELEEKNREIDELKRKFAEEMEQMKKDLVEEYACDHDIEIEALRKNIAELQGDNAALVVENDDLNERVNSLVYDLSIKEATWCDNEEKMKIEMQKTWGEKYAEWMQRTEQKLEELQQANTLLRGYLKNKKPNAPDPTGQDKS